MAGCKNEGRRVRDDFVAWGTWWWKFSKIFLQSCTFFHSREILTEKLFRMIPIKWHTCWWLLGTGFCSHDCWPPSSGCCLLLRGLFSQSHHPVTVPRKCLTVGWTVVAWEVLSHAGTVCFFVLGFRMWPAGLWALVTVELGEQVDSDWQDSPLYPVECRELVCRGSCPTHGRERPQPHRPSETEQWALDGFPIPGSELS